MIDQYTVYAVYVLITALFISTVYFYKVIFPAGPATESGLWHVPGPFLARFTGLYRVFLLWSGECPWKIHELHKRYGSVVRTGPNHVIVSDPSALFSIYGSGGRFRKVREWARQHGQYLISVD